MKLARNAFTLIELLVVIAIIAILAAILFPVFAQAKASAKNIKSVSNMKQMELAFAMYQSDSNDYYQPSGTMNGNGASWSTGACSAAIEGCPGWDTIMYPYMKNFGIFTSDFDRVPPGFSPDWGNVKKSYRVAGNVVHGWAGVNTWDGQDYGYTPMNATAVPAPAASILLTDQRDPEVYNCTWWPGAWIWECNVWDNRSLNTLSNDDPRSWGSDTDPKIRYTDGIDYAWAAHANFGFCDGHAKSGAKNTIFPGYQRRLDMNHAVDNTLNGVCLDGDPFVVSPNDCALPAG